MDKVRFIRDSLTNLCNLSITLICVFLLIKCNNPKNNDVPLVKPTSISPLMKIMCEETDFSYLFECSNKKNIYQIELSNDPFKDLVLLTCAMNGLELDSIRYARIEFHTPKRKNMEHVYRHRFIINSFTGDTLHIYFGQPRVIYVEKNRAELGRFFLESIWKTKDLFDPTRELDGESWNLKGRAEGKEIEIRRNAMRDTFFYSHVQMLLEICKIEDYKFR